MGIGVLGHVGELVEGRLCLARRAELRHEAAAACTRSERKERAAA